MCVTRGRCGVFAACDGMMESVTWLLTDYSPAHETYWPIRGQMWDLLTNQRLGKMLTDSPPQIDCHDMDNGHNVPDICWTLTVGFYEDDLKVDPWWMLDLGNKKYRDTLKSLVDCASASTCLNIPQPVQLSGLGLNRPKPEVETG